ncbi:MAG: hypothetical protein ACRD3I_13755, partial [Terriglobales bacterium]
MVLKTRHYLRVQSDLGECGAAAIHRHLLAHGMHTPPAIPTINRILRRCGAFDGHHRIRRPAPPPGWYVPAVAAGRAELDQFDVVSGLVIQGGPEVEILTGISLHGGLAVAWPREAITAASSVADLLAHWRTVGLPEYAQFDNDLRFHGPHQYADVISAVVQLCLSVGVTPVFAPPRETGFQAAIESFNGRWQAKVWTRFHHVSLSALQDRSQRYV